MNKTTQHRQIDYLRTFRLCKELGIVKRKRKMPKDYICGGEQFLAGKKLITLLLKHLFPGFTIKFSYSSLHIKIPYEIQNIINQTSHRNFEERVEISTRILSLNSDIRGHILPRIPHQIVIALAAKTMDDRAYKLLRLIGETERPAQNFYNCAKSCLEYSVLFKEHINFFKEFLEAEKIKAEEIIKENERLKQERRQAERIRLAQEHVDDTDEESIQSFAERIEKEKKSKSQEAQLRFNEALKVCLK